MATPDINGQPQSSSTLKKHSKRSKNRKRNLQDLDQSPEIGSSINLIIERNTASYGQAVPISQTAQSADPILPSLHRKKKRKNLLRVKNSTLFGIYEVSREMKSQILQKFIEGLKHPKKKTLY